MPEPSLTAANGPGEVSWAVDVAGELDPVAHRDHERSLDRHLVGAAGRGIRAGLGCYRRGEMAYKERRDGEWMRQAAGDHASILVRRGSRVTQQLLDIPPALTFMATIARTPKPSP